jgi:hypothetical protein
LRTFERLFTAALFISPELSASRRARPFFFDLEQFFYQRIQDNFSLKRLCAETIEDKVH